MGALRHTRTQSLDIAVRGATHAGSRPMLSKMQNLVFVIQSRLSPEHYYLGHPRAIGVSETDEIHPTGHSGPRVIPTIPRHIRHATRQVTIEQHRPSASADIIDGQLNRHPGWQLEPQAHFGSTPPQPRDDHPNFSGRSMLIADASDQRAVEPETVDHRVCRCE